MRFPATIAPLSWLPVRSLWKHFLEDSAAPHPAPPSIGLVLSHGGARGLAHIGVLQVLEEERIPISIIAGSSMGAYVGTLWAAGVNGPRLAELAAEIKDRRALLRLMDPMFPPFSGFVHGNKVREHLRRTLGDVLVEDLQKRMLIVATDLETATGEIMRNVSAVAAVHASCAIPGVCAPVSLNGKSYIDGGAAEPLPVRLLKHEASVDYIIAVNVMRTPADSPDEAARKETPATFWTRFRSALSRNINLFAAGNVLDTFKRCLTAAQMRVTDEEARAADVLIHPRFSDSKWYDFENFERYIAAGRTAAQAALPRIRSLLITTPSTPHCHESVSHHSRVGCGSP